MYFEKTFVCTWALYGIQQWGAHSLSPKYWYYVLTTSCNTPGSDEFKKWLWIWIMRVKLTKSETSAVSGAGHVSEYSSSIFHKVSNSQAFLRSIQVWQCFSSTWMRRNIMVYEAFGKIFEYHECKCFFWSTCLFHREGTEKPMLPFLQVLWGPTDFGWVKFNAELNLKNKWGFFSNIINYFTLNEIYPKTVY